MTMSEKRNNKLLLALEQHHCSNNRDTSHISNLRVSFAKFSAPGVQIHAGSNVSVILLREKNATAEAPVR
jgi:hypothetical protein